MRACIRCAEDRDAGAIAAIYAPFCAANSPVSFEVVPPSAEEMLGRMHKVLSRYPWLVCERDGEVLGYVYAGMFSDRAAYQWSAAVSAYIKEGMRRTDIGRALYESLFECLRVLGHYNAYAGISLPNAGSVGLHTALGFELVGTYREVGFKGGRWHDVAWMQRALRRKAEEPAPPRSFSEVRDEPEIATAIARGLDFLRV